MIVDHAELKSNESQHITGSNGYYLAMQAMAIEVKGLLFISKKDTVILGKAFSWITPKDRVKLNSLVLIPVTDTWYRLEPIKGINLDHSESEMKELEELEEALDRSRSLSLELIGYETGKDLTRYFYDTVTKTYWQHDTFSSTFYQVDVSDLRQYLSRYRHLVTFQPRWENWITLAL